MGARRTRFEPGDPDPNYDRRENAFDLLQAGLAHTSDAWTCLYEASKWSIYFEPDEEDVKNIADELIKLESRLQKIIQQYRR